LTVGKDAGVVAEKGVVEYVAAEAVEDLLLGGALSIPRVQGIEAVVKGERLWLFPGKPSTRLVRYVLPHLIQNLCINTSLKAVLERHFSRNGQGTTVSERNELHQGLPLF